jgi:hypothetical protein
MHRGLQGEEMKKEEERSVESSSLLRGRWDGTPADRRREKEDHLLMQEDGCLPAEGEELRRERDPWMDESRSLLVVAGVMEGGGRRDQMIRDAESLSAKSIKASLLVRSQERSGEDHWFSIGMRMIIRDMHEVVLTPACEEEFRKWEEKMKMKKRRMPAELVLTKGSDQ